MNTIQLTLHPTAFVSRDTDGKLVDKLGLGDIVIRFSPSLKRVIQQSDLYLPKADAKAQRTRSAYTFDIVFNEEGRAFVTKVTKASEASEDVAPYTLGAPSADPVNDIPA